MHCVEDGVVGQRDGSLTTRSGCPGTRIETWTNPVGRVGFPPCKQPSMWDSILPVWTDQESIEVRGNDASRKDAEDPHIERIEEWVVFIEVVDACMDVRPIAKEQEGRPEWRSKPSGNGRREKSAFPSTRHNRTRSSCCRKIEWLVPLLP